MEQEGENIAPILRVAWERVAQYDKAAIRLSHEYYRIRRYTFMFGVVAPYLAFVFSYFFSDTESIIGQIGKSLLILIPTIAAILAIFVMRFNTNDDRFVMRAGAEEVKKEIYLYRTILKNTPSRYQFLKKRLATIQTQVSRSLRGEFSFEQYDGQHPPNMHPDRDPGFADLDGDQYFEYRLGDQLHWHNNRINKYKLERKRMTTLIMAAGVGGSVFAGLGGAFSIGVTVTVSIIMALIAWGETRHIDTIIRNYSKVVTDLTLLYDHWQNLETEERTDAEFFRMVRHCEEVLWAQNSEYIRSLQEVLFEANYEQEARVINDVLRDAALMNDEINDEMEGIRDAS